MKSLVTAPTTKLHHMAQASSILDLSPSIARRRQISKWFVGAHNRRFSPPRNDAQSAFVVAIGELAISGLSLGAGRPVVPAPVITGPAPHGLYDPLSHAFWRTPGN
jgi:hypothetical protein